MPSVEILGGSGSIALDDAVFGVPFNGPLVHEVVVAELAARRRGTHATRTRGLVSGGNSKPYRQKGTGRARQGSIRSPQFAGGGTVFGPHPRHYTVKVNRKARRAALRCALSVHAERASVFGLDAGAFDAPSTARAAELIADRRGGSVLVVLGGEEAVAAKSFRNLAGVSVLAHEDVGVADLVGAATLVASQAAIDALTERAKPLHVRRPDAAGPGQDARPDASRSNPVAAGTGSEA